MDHLCYFVYKNWTDRKKKNYNYGFSKIDDKVQKVFATVQNQEFYMIFGFQKLEMTVLSFFILF